MGDAEINEMMHAELGASVDGLAGGDQVNGAELGGLRWRGVCDADEVEEGVGGANELAVTVGVERIAGDDFAFGGQFGFPARADQYANPVSTLEKNGNEIGADVAGSSRDEDAPGVGRRGQGFDFQQEPDIGDGCSHSLGTLPEAVLDRHRHRRSYSP